MPNFNKVSKKEEIVIANIDRTIGRFQARKEMVECEIEGQASEVVIKLLETTRCEILTAREELYSTRIKVSKVINRVMGQLKFREEIARCEVEEDIYKDTRTCLDIILKDYIEVKQSSPKVCGVCEVILV